MDSQFLSKRQFLFVAVVTGFMAFLVFDLYHWWTVREDYSFGFLAPVFAVFVAYDRLELIKDRLSISVSGSSSIFQKSLYYLVAVCFVFALLIFCMGSVLRAMNGAQLISSFFMVVSFSAIMLLGIYLFSFELGSGASFFDRLGVCRLFLFSALIWIVAAPLVPTLENQVTLTLREYVTDVVSITFDILGFPLYRQGNVLELPTGQVGVEDACSGIRSLTACLFAGSFLASIYIKQLWRKVLFVFLASAFAFASNLLRSFILTAWAYNYGPESLEGFIHDSVGYVELFATVIALLLVLPLFRFELTTYEPVED